MAVSDSDESVKVAEKSKVKVDQGDPESEGSDGESEYEIEEVLDARRGFFPEVLFFAMASIFLTLRRVFYVSGSNGLLREVEGLWARRQ